MPDNEKIIDRIRKLLAMALGNENEHEAAAFAQKAADLLSEYGLAISDVSEQEKGEIEEHMWETMYLDPWRRRIIHQAAKLYFCDIFLQTWYDRPARKERAGVVLVGRRHNVYIAQMMAEYLINTTMRLAIEYQHTHYSPTMTPRSVRLAFERGCGEMLAHRLYKLRVEREQGDQARTNGNPNNLPALYADESALVKAYIDAMSLKDAKIRKSDIETVHSRRGMLAANAVSLDPQIESKHVTHLIGVKNEEDSVEERPEDSERPESRDSSGS